MFSCAVAYVFCLTGTCAAESETMDTSTTMPDESSKRSSFVSTAGLTGLIYPAHVLQKQAHNTVCIFTGRGVHRSSSTSNQQCAVDTTNQGVQTV